jgi:hypothetical protein
MRNPDTAPEAYRRHIEVYRRMEAPARRVELAVQMFCTHPSSLR